ncbi:MAG: hypothetical protein LBE20_07245 [Deltaproteobacteria bacterium]|nr:hypothetical protein [Deltaproteobacteria bacterium]
MDISDILNEVYNLNKNSLASYIVDAEPYVTNEQELVFKKIQQIAKEQSAFVQEILNCMQDLEVIPHSFSFPSQMSELNYLSMNYLKKVLLQELSVEQEQMLLFIEELKKEKLLSLQHPISLLEKAKNMLEQFAIELTA